MTITLLFLSVLLAFFLGWIFSQTINVRPWVSGGDRVGTLDRLPAFFTAPRVGLVTFLAVVSSLFALTVSAYAMRMELGADWIAVPTPGLLWFNTALLLLGSVFLQRAWNAASRNRMSAVRSGLMVGGLFTVAFILGQYLVWVQLRADGHYLTANPANAFFFLLTALHALHLLGGLVAWAVTVRKVWYTDDASRIRARVELCAVYWHYLLVLWAMLFGLLLFT